MELQTIVKKTRKFLRKYKKLIRLLLLIFIILLSFFYVSAFFSSGVEFLDAFLKRSGKGDSVIYTGRDSYGDIILTVHQRSKTTVDISYQVPYNKLKAYTLILTENERKNPDLPAAYNLTIQSGNGTILFDGKYQRGDPFLYSKTSLPEYSDIETYRRGENPYLSFEPNLRRMAGIAYGEYDHRRGNWLYLILGLALIFLVCFDVKRPVVTLKIRETLLDGGPHPADLSELIQFLVRAVVVVVGIGFLLAAL